ncbi:MAG TPA: DNA alkylation repair protein [Flavisolibacter sp.]|nr:DNA alkylation repair protein [Flavisolibacter sp.]
MGSLLKDIYSLSFYNKLSKILIEVIPGFKKVEFIKTIFTPDFETKELKDRMRHTAKVLHDFFPPDYSETIKLIKTLISKCREKGMEDGGLEYFFLPDYIETYGLDDYETSVKALEYITQFVSCEFGVRPFLVKYGDKMMKQMLAWSKHKNYKVRRLASEGSRPRLPWAMAVPALKKDPKPILPILENLKNDPSESVRRSVANNLNDIAKDHPEIVLLTAQKWTGISKETDAVIKHGSRTLLKQGHVEILKHYGLDAKNIRLGNFKIINPEIKIGHSLEFVFEITNMSVREQKVRLEYAIFYRKQNGQASKKVFKISEKIYQPKAKETIQRKQKFILITTRKFYIGAHKLSIIINGVEKAIGIFVLIG